MNNIKYEYIKLTRRDIKNMRVVKIEDDTIYKPEEVANILKISKPTILEFAKKGEIDYYKIGKKIYRFSGRHIKEYLQRKELKND
jgi:excisionase family DNA binding protein